VGLRQGGPESGPADLVPETPPAGRVEQIQILLTGPEGTVAKNKQDTKMKLQEQWLQKFNASRTNQTPAQTSGSRIQKNLSVTSNQARFETIELSDQEVGPTGVPSVIFEQLR